MPGGNGVEVTIENVATGVLQFKGNEMGSSTITAEGKGRVISRKKSGRERNGDGEDWDER